MGGISAQVSLCPLHQEILRTAIDKTLAIFRQHKLERLVYRCEK
jgi:hypothetical protein